MSEMQNSTTVTFENSMSSHNSFSNTSLQREPMTVGRIVDRSLRLAPVMFKSLLAFALFISALDGFEILAQMFFSENKAMLVVVKIIGAANNYLSGLFYILTILYAAKFWIGEKPDFAACRDQLTFKRFLSGALVSIQVSLVGGLGLLLFVLPGFLFILNRSLAYPILYLERTDRTTALNRSTFLMKQMPWYKAGSPVARLSLLFGIQLFTTGVASIILVGAPIWIVYQGMSIYIQAFATFLSAVVLQFLTMFATLSLVGFYLDMKVRYEGEDLLKSLDG